MRLSSITLTTLQTFFGSFDLTLRTDNSTYLRFGYWEKVNVEQLQKILDTEAKVVEHWIDDEDTGMNYYYELE